MTSDVTTLHITMLHMPTILLSYVSNNMYSFDSIYIQ